MLIRVVRRHVCKKNDYTHKIIFFFKFWECSSVVDLTILAWHISSPGFQCLGEIQGRKVWKYNTGERAFLKCMRHPGSISWRIKTQGKDSRKERKRFKVEVWIFGRPWCFMKAQSVDSYGFWLWYCFFCVLAFFIQYVLTFLSAP